MVRRYRRASWPNGRIQGSTACPTYSAAMLAARYVVQRRPSGSYELADRGPVAFCGGSRINHPRKTEVNQLVMANGRYYLQRYVHWMRRACQDRQVLLSQCCILISVESG